MPSERAQRRIDGLLDDAEAAANRRDGEDVARSVRMALRLDPENTDARDLHPELTPQVARFWGAGQLWPGRRVRRTASRLWRHESERPAPVRHSPIERAQVEAVLRPALPELDRPWG